MGYHADAGDPVRQLDGSRRLNTSTDVVSTVIGWEEIPGRNCSWEERVSVWCRITANAPKFEVMIETGTLQE